MPKILRKRGLNKKERSVMGVLTTEMESQAIIHSFIIFTSLKIAIGGILIPYALIQHNKVTMIPRSPKLSLYTYVLPTCQTIWHKESQCNWSSIAVWFVFCIQTCVHFHHVMKVTTEFCSPSKFSRWLPFGCCPQLHILLFPQCKPPIPISQ